MSRPNLFTPLQLGPYELANRVLMAPMTRNRSPETVPTESNAVYYAQRASAGLIVTEATQVSPQGVGYPATPGIHSDEQVGGWRAVTGAVHARGGRIFAQLWHVGRISHPSLQPDNGTPVAPSAIAARGNAITLSGPQPFPVPRALETEEIAGVVADFARAARNAMAAGFDGVELHGANGYLIDQFLRSGSNHRTDRYGGSVENRARFLVELTRAIIDVWGPDRVGVRLSPSGTFNDMHDERPRETFAHAVRALDALGIGYLHLVEAGEADARHGGDGHDAIPASFFRPLFRHVLIANGGYDRERGDAAIAAGHADAVAFGQLFLANPDLPERLRRGGPFNLPDVASFYGGTDAGYIDYPLLDPDPSADLCGAAAAAGGGGDDGARHALGRE